MAKDIETIKQEIDLKIRQTCIGKFYSDYNVGITKNPQDRVFKDHNVNRNKCHWIFETHSKEDASAIEAHFLNKGMKGGSGGRIDDECIFVYVYRITEHTVEAPKLELIEEAKGIKTVEIYSGKSEFAERFYKVRVIGEYQLDSFSFEKEKSIKLAELEADKIKGELLISNPSGKL